MRKIDNALVRKLKLRRAAKPTLKDLLLDIPAGGGDTDFTRVRDTGRPLYWR